MDKRRFVNTIKDRIAVRWHMSLICAATIASGVLVSKGILYYSNTEPMWRYSIAVLSSYAVFFLLVQLWIRIHFKARVKSANGNDLDATDFMDVPTSVDIPTPAWRGSGGQFSGGGASGSWDSGESNILNSNKSFGKFSLSDAGDLDDAVVILAFLTVLVAIFGSAGFLIYQAPEILLEAAFEVILATGLVRQAKKMQADGWFYSVFKKTWWLCGLILVASMCLGFAMKKACPEAYSFAQFREMCWNKSKL